MTECGVFSRLLSLLKFVLYCCESLVLFFTPDSWRRFKSLDGDVVLITGAGNGIGRILALKLAARGAKIVVWDVDEAGIRETVGLIKRSGGVAFGYTCDVSDRHAVYKTATLVQQQVGTVYMLVNNAGIGSGKSILETEDESIERIMRINTLSQFWTVKAFLGDMMKSGRGHVVTIASLAGMQGTANMADYCASKFACVGLHESFMVELRGAGFYDKIATTLVCPFFINTGMFAGVKTGLLPFLDPEYVASRIERSILLEETQLVIPRWLNYLVVLKLILSYKSMFELDDAVKLLPDMEHFHGRAVDKRD